MGIEKLCLWGGGLTPPAKVMFDPAVARTCAARFTEAKLHELQDICLDVHSTGAEVSVSSGSGSISINLLNCVSILENLEEALRIQAAGAGDPNLTAEPFSSGVSRANIYIE